MNEENNNQNYSTDKKDNPAPDEFLDCTGLYCPVPIFEARKKTDSIKSGKVLQLIADDPASEEDIKSWANATGNELLKLEKDGDRFIFYIRKK